MHCAYVFIHVLSASACHIFHRLHHSQLPAYLKEMKKYHLAHHYKNFDLGFGVTSMSHRTSLLNTLQVKSGTSFSIPSSLFEMMPCSISILAHFLFFMDFKFHCVVCIVELDLWANTTLLMIFACPNVGTLSKAYTTFNIRFQNVHTYRQWRKVLDWLTSKR